MTCNGICHRYKAKKPSDGGRYASGQKRCQICEIFIAWEGLWCPCCRYRLRTKPRNKEYKAKLQSIPLKFGDRVILYVKSDGVTFSTGTGTLIKALGNRKYDNGMELWKAKTENGLTVARFVNVEEEPIVN